VNAAETLERSQWDHFWVPPDVTVVDRPELLLYACARDTSYLNTVVRTRAPDGELPALIAEAEGHYRGRRARWLVPDTFPTAGLEAALGRSGWAETERFEVRALDVAAWARPPSATSVAVTTRTALLDAYAVADAAFGRATTHTEAEIALDLAACREGTRVHRFVAYEAGEPVAVGGMTAFPALGFGLLWGGGTAPGARGRGAYSAVLGARIARAKALGLTTVGLYARVETSAPIVARLGFGRFGEMRYFEREVPG
jgi:hypothetical protein